MRLSVTLQDIHRGPERYSSTGAQDSHIARTLLGPIGGV